MAETGNHTLPKLWDYVYSVEKKIWDCLAYIISKVLQPSLCKRQLFRVENLAVVGVQTAKVELYGKDKDDKDIVVGYQMVVTSPVSKPLVPTSALNKTGITLQSVVRYTIIIHNLQTSHRIMLDSSTAILYGVASIQSGGLCAKFTEDGLYTATIIVDYLTNAEHQEASEWEFKDGVLTKK
jgi:hypothetical protein